jgi:hypothetical protein
MNETANSQLPTPKATALIGRPKGLPYVGSPKGLPYLLWRSPSGLRTSVVVRVIERSGHVRTSWELAVGRW